jgi:uncharacterized membrane protein
MYTCNLDTILASNRFVTVKLRISETFLICNVGVLNMMHGYGKLKINF